MSPGASSTNKDKDSAWEDLGESKTHGNCYSIDCKFIVDSDVILVNRMVFALESAEFEKLLSDGKTEIRLSGEDPTTFRNLRYIIYNKSIRLLEHFSMLEVFDIYELSQRYAVSYVLQLCRSHVKALLKTSLIPKVLAAYWFAIEVDDFISQSDSSQLDVFNKIADYINSAPEINKMRPGAEETKKELLKRCLKRIDFGKMTALEFMDGPGKSNILVADEKYFVLSQMVSRYTYQAQNQKFNFIINLSQRSLFNR